MRQLYLAVALPKMTYGINVWYLPPRKPAGATKNKESVSVLKSLQKIQCIATLAINGGLCTTPMDLLDAHTGILPLELALSKACHRAIVQILTLSKAHPLFQIVRSTKCVASRKHQGPIDYLIASLSLGKVNMETITTTPGDPHLTPHYKRRIQASREDSIAEEAQDKADFKVFSDGSGLERGIGAAAVIYRKGSNISLNHLKAYLGPSTKHNSYKGEAVGGLLACWLIRNTIGTGFKTVSIYIDNQALIKVMAASKASSGQYLVQAFADMANNLTAKATE